MTSKDKSTNARRIGKLLLFLFSLIGISVFCLGVNPWLFQQESENLTVTRIITWTLAPMFVGLGLIWYDIGTHGFSGMIEKVNQDWRRTLLYGWSICGMGGLLMSALPFFSMTIYLISLIWGVVVILSMVLWRWQNLLFHRLIVVTYFPSFLFIMAGRLWIDLIGFHWVWFIPFLGAYLFTWSLPKLLPRISTIVFREQYFPNTKSSKWFIRIIYTLIISVPLVGAFGSKAGGEKFEYLFLAIPLSFISVAFAQVFAHQIFTDTPFDELFSAQ